MRGLCTFNETWSPQGSCAKRGRPVDAKGPRSYRRRDPRLEPGQVESLRRGSRGMDAERVPRSEAQGPGGARAVFAPFAATKGARRKGEKVKMQRPSHWICSRKSTATA